MLSMTSSPGLVDPIYETLRSPERPTEGHKVAWIAEKLGVPFMPWQRLVVDVGKELVPADEQTLSMFAARGADVSEGLLVPAYREVVVTIMRQNGKTLLVLPVKIECMWTPNRMVAATAQSGVDARQKHVEDEQPLIRRSAIHSKVQQYYKAADNTGLWFRNDSRLKVLNTGESVGHGKTLDLAHLDETWADKDSAREQALSPAMVTKPLAQFWNTSTAGTQSSTYLRRKVEAGRAAVQAGKREGIAYFEWAIPENEDVYSPDSWAKYMPAYGITISRRVLESEAERLSDGDFRRAYGNQWTETEDRIIPAEWWLAVVDPAARVGEPVYAVDAKPDRSAAAVAKSDGQTIELVAVRPGVLWVVEAFREKVPTGTVVVVDGNGPAAGVGDELAAAGYNVRRFASLEVRKACAAFFDGIADRRLRVRKDDRLDEAVKHAARKSTADSWAWHREATGGEMLVACSLAYTSDPQVEVQVMVV